MKGVSLTLLSDLRTLLLLLGWLVQPLYKGLCLVLLHLVLFCLAVLSWRPDFFSEEEIEGECIWGRGEEEGIWEVCRRRGNLCGDVLFERRLYFQ